jgi:uncharacterized membrane protein
MQVDPSWPKALLAAHVVAGGICLVVAPMVLSVAKGGPTHRRWGKVYFWSMAAVAASALVIALYRPIPFLAVLAVLSFYLAFSGRRVLSLKALAAGGSAGAIDWLAAIATFAACAALAGLRVLWTGVGNGQGIVALVFGALGMLAAAGDMRRFARKPRDPMFWLGAHLQKFMASYIAALTAFSAVTLSRLLPNAGLVVWLWPTVLGVPAITLTSLYYRRKSAPLHGPLPAARS